MTLETIIEGLSFQEKIAAMELIWRELSAEPVSFPSPAWHEAVVADRLATPMSSDSVPLNKARQAVREAIDARRTPN